MDDLLMAAWRKWLSLPYPETDVMLFIALVMLGTVIYAWT